MTTDLDRAASLLAAIASEVRCYAGNLQGSEPDAPRLDEPDLSAVDTFEALTDEPDA